MDALLGGFLSGVAGASSAYGDIKSEQRQYELDNKKAQQAQMRKESFAKFQYSLQDSGLVNQQGRKMSNEQVDAMEGPEQSALESRDDRKARVTEETRLAKIEEQKVAAEGVRDEKREYEAQLLKDKNALKKSEQEAKDSAKKKKRGQEIKEAFVKDSNKDINTKAKDSDFDGVTADVEAVLSFVAENRDNPQIATLPKVKAASKVYKDSLDFLAKFEANKGFWSGRKSEIAKTVEEMRKDGMSETDVNRVKKYLSDTGKLK